MAQVDVEPFRKQLGDDRVGANVDVRFSGRSGNTEGLTLGGSGLVGGRHAKNFGFIIGNGDYSHLNGETQLARYFVHTRYNRSLLEWLLAEGYAQISHNRFQRLVLRRLLGAGPRFDWTSSGLVSFFYAASYMFELETIDTEESDDGNILSHRLSNTLGLLWNPDDRVAFTLTIYAQPRVDDFADYRVLGQSTLEFRIVDRLSASIAAKFRYDSRPPIDVKRHDLELVNSLGLRF